MPKRLPVTGDCSNVVLVNVAFFYDGHRCRTKRFAYLSVEFARLIQLHIKRFASGSEERASERFGVGMGMRSANIHDAIAKTDQSGIDAVHAGAGH